MNVGMNNFYISHYLWLSFNFISFLIPPLLFVTYVTYVTPIVTYVTPIVTYVTYVTPKAIIFTIYYLHYLPIYC